MLYEVRVYNPDGDLTKVFSRNQLSKKYWKKFQDDEDKISLQSNGRTQVPRWVREHLDLEFIELQTSSQIHP